MAVTMNAATFMVKEFPRQSEFHCEYNRSHTEEMFDISAKLVGEQDAISNVDTIRWEKHSWKYLSLFGDETVINLQRAKVYVFSDSVLCLGKGPSTSKCQRIFEGQNRMEHNFSKLQRL